MAGENNFSEPSQAPSNCLGFSGSQSSPLLIFFPSPGDTFLCQIASKGTLYR